MPIYVLYLQIKMNKRVLLAGAVAAILAAGCDEGLTFSTDGRHTLAFSQDTVCMDTMLTTVASASWSFMVYNRNDVALKADAMLSGGASSPFRMNIDGEGGTTVAGLEIPAGDSLFCLISAVIPQSADMQPFIVSDSIRFILESGVVQQVQLRACGQNAVMLHGRRIESDETFSAQLPYVVYDSLYVAPGATLTLQPGTRLLFHSGAWLDVAGCVRAQGTQDSMVTMRGDRLDRMFTDLPYDLLDGQWGGVRLRGESFDNSFIHCDIHGGSWGVAADSSALDGLKFEMLSSVVSNVTGNGIEATGCSITVANSQITNAGLYCASITGGSCSFNFCTVASFSPWRTGSAAVLLSDRVGERKWDMKQAIFSNCIITGRHDRELVDSRADTAAVCSVDHSLVLTTDSLNPAFHDVVFENRSMQHCGADNFRYGTLRGYEPVFLLDSISPARGIADTAAAALWPSDLAGVIRPAAASAGCYEYVETIKKLF